MKLPITELKEAARWAPELVKNVIKPDTSEVVSQREIFTSPWPQPSPIFPKELAPTVLSVPEAEIREFLSVVVRRYVRSVRTFWPLVGVKSAVDPVRAVSDERFGEIIERSPFGRFLNPEIEEDLRARWSKDLQDVKGTAFKIDLRNLSQIETHEGLYSSGAAILLDRHEGNLSVLRIDLGESEHRPTDPAWSLAKMFALQSMAMELILCVHPRIHFPMDSINAVTKSLLPQRHWLRALIEPHCYMQLPLNFAVLYVRKSVLHNDQNEVYTPFVGTKESIYKVVRDGYVGIEGNSSFPAYRYPMSSPRIHSPYGDYIQKYEQVIESFVGSVVETQHRDDRVTLWADEIAALVPGFPTGAELDSETLTRAVTTFISNVAVQHSADHFSYAKLPIQEVPLRMRVQPPSTGDLVVSEPGEWVYRRDLFRQEMARKMYFAPTVIRRLDRCEYDSSLIGQALIDEFHADLRAVDRSFESENRYTPLSQLACSIQY